MAVLTHYELSVYDGCPMITARKLKFSIKDLFSIWPHLLKKSLIENFIFCAADI